jgi:glycosyltransferase involved in cell wall biosynthesis
MQQPPSTFGFSLAEPTPVLVIIPVYNAERAIRESVRSVMAQSYPNIILVAVDDGSTDKSSAILRQLQQESAQSCRFRPFTVLRLEENVGTYNAANFALFYCKFQPFGLFLIHGADDIMYRHKIKKQVQALMSSNAHICTAGYERVDERGNVRIRKLHGHSMAMYRKYALDELGYYDDTRFGGDSELLARYIKNRGAKIECRVPEVLSRCLLTDANLTKRYPVGGPEREAYVKKYTAIHEQMAVTGNFFVPTRWTEKAYVGRLGKKVVAGVATIKSRITALRDMVESILPQIDELIVYQNDYADEFEFLRHPKIQVLNAATTGQNMGDAGKFFKVTDYPNAIYFSLDDDLLYPPDYVERTLQYLREYNYQVIVTSHGRNLRPDATSYYKHAADYYPALKDLLDPHFVQFGGTGVMAFDTELVKISFQDFKAPNMADIWMALYARQADIPLLVFPHAAGWLRMHESVDRADTIWAHSQVNSALQDELIQQFDKTAIVTPW